MSVTHRIAREWRAALSLLSAHLQMPPNFLISTYEHEASICRPPGQELNGKVTIQYTAGGHVGNVNIMFKDHTHNIAYISVKYDFASGAMPNGETEKWELVTATSVWHVTKDSTVTCPMWLRLERDEDGEIKANICCDAWKRNLDPSKPLSIIEKKEFAVIELDGHVLPSVKGKGPSMNMARALQVKILQSELKKARAKFDYKLTVQGGRIELLEKLLAAETEERKKPVNPAKPKQVRVKKEPKGAAAQEDETAKQPGTPVAPLIKQEVVEEAPEDASPAGQQLPAEATQEEVADAPQEGAQEENGQDYPDRSQEKARGEEQEEDQEANQDDNDNEEPASKRRRTEESA
jgi:hypothetical protein